MITRIIALLLIFFVSNSISAQQIAKKNEKPTLKIPALSAKSWLLMDYNTGTILAEKDAHKQFGPASITKVMTGYLIAEAIQKGEINQEDLVKVSINAWKQRGSRMFINEGSQISVQNLVTGLIVQSGNDASVALAEHLSGNEEVFAERMNKKAQELGMKNSNFVNSNGLPNDNHYSSAYDLALLSRALIHNFPEHYQLYSQKSFTWNKIKQNNRNKLLWTNPDVDGIKTGHTDDAGFNIAVSAMRDGIRLIVVILGSPSENDRQQSATNLTNFAFTHFNAQNLYKRNEEIYTIPVRNGIQATTKLGFGEDINVILPSTEYSNIRAELKLKNYLSAPVVANEEVGKLKIYFNEVNLYNFPVITLENIDQLEIQERIWLTFKRKLHNRYERFKTAL